MRHEQIIDEIERWAAEMRGGHFAAAERHRQALYHKCAAMVASHETQSLAMELWHHPLDQQVIENVRLFLGLVEAAADRTARGHAPASMPIRQAA